MSKGSRDRLKSKKRYRKNYKEVFRKDKNDIERPILSPKQEMKINGFV